jgi:hypothetical protein
LPDQEWKDRDKIKVPLSELCASVVNMFSNECSECAVSPLYFSASRPEGPLTIRVFK